MGVMWCGERILSTRRCVALSALTTRALVPQPPTTFRPDRCCHCHHLHPPLPLSPITAAATNTTTVPSSPPKPQPPPNCNAAAATTATSERHHHRHHSHRYLIPSSAPSPSPVTHLPHNITFCLPHHHLVVRQRGCGVVDGVSTPPSLRVSEQFEQRAADQSLSSGEWRRSPWRALQGHSSVGVPIRFNCCRC